MRKIGDNPQFGKEMKYFPANEKLMNIRRNPAYMK